MRDNGTVWAAFFLVGLLGCSLAIAAQDNLLQNGELSLNADGETLGWSDDGLQKLSVDRQEKPAGAQQSLKVRIILEDNGPKAGDGALVQWVKVQPNTVLRLEADLKSTKPKMAVCQIKLLKTKRELQRVDLRSAKTDWETVSKVFSTGEADMVQLLLRYPQTAEAVGQTVWFANVQLMQAPPGTEPEPLPVSVPKTSRPATTLPEEAPARLSGTKIGLPEPLAPQATTEQPDRAPLHVLTTLKTAVERYPLSGGIPLPMGALIHSDHARVLAADGAELPAQCSALSRWPDGSIRWLLVETQADPAAAKGLALEYGPAVARKATVTDPVQVQETADAVTFQSGSFRWRASKNKGLKLFDEVALGERVLTGGNAGSGPRVGEALAALAAPREFRVEEAGPLRATLLVRGIHQDAQGKKNLDYTLRATFFAGLPCIRVQYTFVQTNEPIFERVRDLAITVPLTQAGTAVFGTGAEQAHTIQLAQKPAVLVQSTGQYNLEGWKFPFSIRHGDAQIAGGERAPGWLDVSGRSGGVAVIVKDFWQNCPKSLTASNQGLGIGLVPKEEALVMHTGMAKTHEMLLVFHEGPWPAAQARVRPMLACFQDAPLLMGTPEWTARTRAFGEMTPLRPGKHAMLENQCLEFVRRPFVLQREMKGLYGQIDYGDTLYNNSLDFCWNNMETAFDHGLFTLALRTGDKTLMDLARSAARHFGDIDLRHCNPGSFDYGMFSGPKVPIEEAERLAKGFRAKTYAKAHTKNQHILLPIDGPADQKREYTGCWPGKLPDPTVRDVTGWIYQHCFNHNGYGRADGPQGKLQVVGESYVGGHNWILGLLDNYLLTGDRRALEDAETVGQAYLRDLINKKDSFKIYSRETGWPTLNLLGLYAATNKLEYLKGAQHLLQFLSDSEANKHPNVASHYTYSILQAFRDYHLLTNDPGAKEFFLRRLDASLAADLAKANDAGIFSRIRLFANERGWGSMADLAYGWRLTGDSKKYLEPIIPNLQVIAAIMPDASALWSAPWVLAALDEAGLSDDLVSAQGKPFKYSFLSLRPPHPRVVWVNDPGDEEFEVLVFQMSGYKMVKQGISQASMGSISVQAPNGKIVAEAPLDHFGMHIFRLKVPRDGQRGAYRVTVDSEQSFYDFATDAPGLVAYTNEHAPRGLANKAPELYFRVPAAGSAKVTVTLAYAPRSSGFRLYRPNGSLFAERVAHQVKPKSSTVSIPDNDPGRGGIWRVEMCNSSNEIILDGIPPLVATEPALLFEPKPTAAQTPLKKPAAPTPAGKEPAADEPAQD